MTHSRSYVRGHYTDFNFIETDPGTNVNPDNSASNDVGLSMCQDLQIRDQISLRCL